MGLAYEVLKTHADKASKSFLTDPPLEFYRYDAFRYSSFPLRLYMDGTYTLKNRGSSLADLSSYAALRNSEQSILASMTAPFVISKSSTPCWSSFPRSSNPTPLLQSCPTMCRSRSYLPPSSSWRWRGCCFRGGCVNAEVERQKAKLRDRIEGSVAIRYEPKASKGGAPENYVLWYNAQDTVPWRRNNEIAVAMEAADGDRQGGTDRADSGFN